MYAGARLQLALMRLSSGAALADFLTPPLRATGAPVRIPNCRGSNPAFRLASRFREPSFSVNNVVGGPSDSFGVVLCQTFGYPAQRAQPDARRLRPIGEPKIPGIVHQRVSVRLKVEPVKGKRRDNRKGRRLFHRAANS
jgi:hypothetical protein